MQKNIDRLLMIGIRIALMYLNKSDLASIWFMGSFLVPARDKE